MRLENLTLQNFKNYEDFKILFSPGLNCIVGRNGSGKTNLLDAIHFLCLTRSALNSVDSELLFPDKNFFWVKGFFNLNDEKTEIVGSFRKPEGKSFTHDKVTYKRFSDHVGQYPVVFMSPNDTDLVRDSGETRRKFFDNLLCQLDKEYLQDLSQYKSVLMSRNALLKNFSERRFIDRELLDTFDDQLIALNFKIYYARKKLLSEFEKFFWETASYISDSNEKVDIKYKTDVSDVGFHASFKNSLEDDIFLGRTSKGVHKDDFIMLMNGEPIKKTGSQGQQKTLVVALQMAKYSLLEKHKGYQPILLLDDIMDKLDEERMQKLINLVARQKVGQVFITDAHPDRIKQYYNSLNVQKKFIQIDNAEIIYEETGKIV